MLPESGTEYKIRFMLRKNVCEIMLDTTGEGLHKRGYRRNAMEAPIRETLAATIADLGRVRRDSLVAVSYTHLDVYKRQEERGVFYGFRFQ